MLGGKDNSVVKFVEIPGGTVVLTDARRGESRNVNLRPFAIATTTVTASEFATGRSCAEPAGLPAAGVRWLDAVRWCNAASRADGLPPAYQFDGDDVYWDAASAGYRLPTEAEWVHASRAGSSGPRYGTLCEIGWSVTDYVDGPQPVATKAPNALGLFDTLGNVWEWCWDRIDPARYGDYRLLKGGGWADPKWSCRFGVRRGTGPEMLVDDTGFRPARGAVAAPGEDGGQGWSEAADRRRATSPGPLPVGWTQLP